MMRIRPSRPVLAGAVALAALIVYANSLANRFAYDDVAVIVEDPRVHGLGHLARILQGPYWAFTRALGLYRPLTSVSFALEWTLAGGAPWLFHAVNVALHAAVCVLLFLLLEQLAGRIPALVGALLFAVHPVHTEVVANVVGQAELLAAAGTLGACLLWLRRPAGRAPGAVTVATVALAYAVALFSKESAIVAPALLILLDLAQRRVTLSRRGVLTYARETAPIMAVLAGVAALYLGARYLAIGSLVGKEVAPALPFLTRDHAWVGLRVWPEYLRLLVFPLDLSADYSPAVILPVHGWTPATITGTVLLASVGILALATPARPRLGLPFAWFLVTIVIVSNLFFPVGVALAERTLYLPSVAVALVVAFAWAPLAARYGPRALATLTACVILAFSARTWIRNPDWRDQDAVVNAMVRDHPESGRAQWFIAFRAGQRGDMLEADRAWELAYRLWPQNSQLVNEFAMFNVERDRPLRALALLREAQALHPNDPRSQEIYGMALVKLGRYRDAVDVGDRLLKILPDAPGPNEVRARAYMGLGDYKLAAAAWRRVVLYPSTWVQWAGLGRSLARIGDYPGAVAAFDSAQRRAHTDTAALRQIAGFRLLTQREQAEARSRPASGGR